MKNVANGKENLRNVAMIPTRKPSYSLNVKDKVQDLEWKSLRRVAVVSMKECFMKLVRKY